MNTPAAALMDSPMYDRTAVQKGHPTVTTAPHPRTMAPAAPRTVTAEDAAKARKAIEELERIERLITSVLVVLGVGGLIFTAVNVTVFAIEHHVHWAIAWMLDPLVSISLLAALFIDGKLSAHGYRPSGWPFLLRWFAGLATWLMNCWGSLYPDAKFTGWPDSPDPAGLLLHSVVPFLVILLAEAGAGYRKFSTSKKAEHSITLRLWKDQEEARVQAEVQERRRREDADRETAEAERKRAADLVAEEKRADLEARKARELSEAKARQIRAEEDAEARRAERARKDAEARSALEREAEARRENAEESRLRRDAEARELQARIDRENAEHTAELERQRIHAEAQAGAEQARVEAELKAAAEAREERRRTTEARRAQTAIPAAETTAIPQGRTALPALEATAIPNGRTAIPSAAATAQPRKLTALPTALPDERTAEVDDVRGAEAKRRQIEDANFEAAVLIFTETAPTRRDFATRYGRGETWGRDRYADAARLMDEDTDFAARVLGEAEQRTASARA